MSPRGHCLAQDSGGCEVKLSHCIDRHAIVGLRRLDRHKTEFNIVQHTLGLTLPGRPITTAASCFNPHAVAGLQGMIAFENSLDAAVGALKKHITHLALAPAMEPPGRAASAVDLEIEPTSRRDAIDLLHPQAAPISTRAARIRPHCVRLEVVGTERFLHFDRHVGRIAVHIGSRWAIAVSLSGCPPTAADRVQVVERQPGLGMPTMKRMHTVGAVMRSRSALGECLPQGVENRVHHRWNHVAR